MITASFAFIAGILTVAAPCILPVLPVLLGASIGQTSSLRPAFIALGFVVSFSAFVLIFSILADTFVVNPNVLRTIAVFLLVIFGSLMLWPRAFEWTSAWLGRPFGKGHRAKPRFSGGNAAGFLLGTTLGLVWTPCAGPVLGSILTVIATSADIRRAGFLLGVYAVGAAVPMLAIAYGGQAITTRVGKIARFMPRLQRAFGVVIIALAVAMYFQYDTLITTWLTGFYPDGRIGL